MTPEQAAQQRQQALSNLTSRLAHLSSAELRPGLGGRLDTAILDYQGRIASIEAVERHANQPPRSDEERIQQTIVSMAARGLGRV